jgi:hypothetical protein
MRHHWELLFRQYRLGFCATLLLLDAVLLALFGLDLYRYASDGYELGVPRVEWLGPALRDAWLHGVVMLLFLALVAPVLVASIRVLATWLRLPAMRWSPTALGISHTLLALLITVLVLVSVHMQLAAGRRLKPSNLTHYLPAFPAATAWIPQELESLVRGIPVYVKSPGFLLKIGAIVFGLIAGREVLVRQREFLNDYAAASRLTDFDTSYLPLLSKARRVTSLRACAPLSPAMDRAIHRALEAEQSRRYVATKTSSRARTSVAEALLGGTSELTIRFLPDVLSTIFTAISNEAADCPIVLFRQNHSGVNEFLQRWFGTERAVVVGPPDTWTLQPWEFQRKEFIAGLKAHFQQAPANMVLVLPLVSYLTGQILEVKALVEDVRSWSSRGCVILDASYLNVTRGTNIYGLNGEDYCCLNLSQWISCSEPCGILITRRTLSPDANWENEPLFSPVNVRTISAFHAALEHAFRKSQSFNEPLERSTLLLTKFRGEINHDKLAVLSIPDLSGRSYFLSVRPVAGKMWSPTLTPQIRELGLLDSALEFREHTPLMLAFPPYVDFWHVDRTAALLNKSVI